MSKITIKQTVSQILDENTYVVFRDGKGFIVDASGDFSILDAIIDELNIKIEAVLLTHGHFDHCMLAKHYQNKGAKIYINEGDADKLYTKKNLSLAMHLSFDYTHADVFVSDGDVLNIADIEIKVMSAPGHTKGGVCYIIDEINTIFTGDTIFKLSYGRTDFFDGNENELKESIKKLFALDKDYVLLTGHGEPTSLFYEKKNNPITWEL